MTLEQLEMLILAEKMRGEVRPSISPPQRGDSCSYCLLPIAFYPGPQDFTPHCFEYSRRGEVDHYIYYRNCRDILIARLLRETAELRWELGRET